MYRLFIISITILSANIQISFAQKYSLGNVYQIYQSIPKLTKDQKTLRKEISATAKQNTSILSDNLKRLQEKGYFTYAHDNVTNNNAKYLLAIDSKLSALQLELNSKVLALENSSWLDSLSNPINSTIYSNAVDYQSRQILTDFKDRYSKLVNQYTLYNEPLSTETNEKFVDEIMKFWKTSDEENLKILERSLARMKELSEQKFKANAQRKEEIEEQHRKEETERLIEKEQSARAKQQTEELQANREKEIASLPSKAVIKAKFRTYKHKNGYIFEMFPVGFTPKPNKASYDKVTYFNKTYTASYREHNDYGINSLVIEFQYSGKISSVTVFKGADPVYIANYRDQSNKPYEIWTKSADGKFQLRIQRSYNVMTDKIEQTISYQYLPLDYNYDDE